MCPRKDINVERPAHRRRIGIQYADRLDAESGPARRCVRLSARVRRSSGASSSSCCILQEIVGTSSSQPGSTEGYAWVDDREQRAGLVVVQPQQRWRIVEPENRIQGDLCFAGTGIYRCLTHPADRQLARRQRRKLSIRPGAEARAQSPQLSRNCFPPERIARKAAGPLPTIRKGSPVGAAVANSKVSSIGAA